MVCQYVIIVCVPMLSLNVAIVTDIPNHFGLQWNTLSSIQYRC